MTIRIAIALVAISLGSLSLHGAQAQVETPSPRYQKIEVTGPDVQAAVKFALADQRRKDGSTSTLLSVISAEHQAVSADNFRLCLSMDRAGRTELARVVLSRNTKKRWSVTLWSWGACQ